MHLLERLRTIRDRALRPLTAALTSLGVRPLAVSVFGVLAMLAFAFTASWAPALAVLFMFLSVFSDVMDGSLARYQHADSAHGRVTDVTADNTSFTIFIFSVTGMGLVGLWWGMTLVALVLLSALLNTKRALRHADATGVPPAALAGYWVFPNYAKALCYGSFLVFVSGGPSLLSSVVMLFVPVMALEVIVRLTALLRHA
ncbi:MAG: CDP-alcohol phosphatidyltransferase family protein [Patescibacteria group bacterium]